MEKINIDEKMMKLFDKLSSYPDFFKLNSQKIKNLKKYFNKFNCSSFPNYFLDFYRITDGMNIGEITFFSINRQKENYVLLFSDYAKKNNIDEYMKHITIEDKNNFMFFANDGDGGRFAFKKKNGKDEVYLFSKYKPDEVIIHESFYDWLSCAIDKAVKNQLNK